MKSRFTAAQLAERILRRRAVEAIIWGIPAVNYDLMLESMIRDAKGAVNQVLYWSRLPSWKNQYLTPNPDTLYFMPFFSTKETGPMVIDHSELPAAAPAGLDLDREHAILAHLEQRRESEPPRLPFASRAPPQQSPLF